MRKHEWRDRVTYYLGIDADSKCEEENDERDGGHGTPVNHTLNPNIDIAQGSHDDES